MFCNIESFNMNESFPLLKALSRHSFMSSFLVSQPSGELEALSSGSLVQLHDAIRSYFQDVDDAPACQWLLRTSDDFGSSYPYQTMKYFREVAESTKDWLLSYETSNQVTY